MEPFLPELLELDSDGFRERFAHTALARTKRRGLARNAAVVLGNTSNPEAVEPLALALAQEGEEVRVSLRLEGAPE